MARDALARLADRVAGEAVQWVWQRSVRVGTLKATQRRARRFARFGPGTEIVFPPVAVVGEGRIALGADTLVGPHASLSAGMPDEAGRGGEPVLVIGDRCVLGKGIGVVAHKHVAIGDDTWTGHYVYITDQNHGYENLELPIGTQMWKDAPVRIGPECWLGHGAVVLPGTTIGRHVVVAAGAVVAGLQVPDYSVVAGVPGRVVRRHIATRGWVATHPDGTPLPGGAGSAPFRG